MKRNKVQSSNTHRSFTTAILAGTIVAVIFSALLTALMAHFILKGNLREETVFAITFVIRMVSTSIGALIGGVIFKEKHLLQVFFTALAYLLFLIGAGIVFFDGSFKNLLSGVLSVSIGAAMTIFILKRKKGNRRKFPKFTH